MGRALTCIARNGTVHALGDTDYQIRYFWIAPVLEYRVGIQPHFIQSLEKTCREYLTGVLTFRYAKPWPSPSFSRCYCQTSCT